MPLYTKLGPATISYILAEIEAAAVIAMDEVSVRAILDCLPMASPRIQVIHTQESYSPESFTHLGDNLHQRGQEG